MYIVYGKLKCLFISILYKKLYMYLCCIKSWNRRIVIRGNHIIIPKRSLPWRNLIVYQYICLKLDIHIAAVFKLWHPWISTCLTECFSGCPLFCQTLQTFYFGSFFTCTCTCKCDDVTISVVLQCSSHES